MKYNSEIWDVIMKLFDYAERQLEAHDKGTMLSEVRGQHEQAMATFSLHRDQLAWFLNYFCGEDCLNAPPGLDRLNAAETEAVQGDIKASSTKEGKRAVKEAQKRLDKRERMRPVLDAQEKLKQAEDARKEKELAAQRDEEARARPKRELKEAQEAEKAAGDEVKKAEETVQKVKP